MADDDRRVEPKHRLVGSGIGTTPERIADIQQRAATLEKLGRPKPTQPFGEVLAAAGANRPAPEESDKHKKLKALPKKGPKPGLKHPAHKKAFGRGQDDDDVIIKG